MKTMQNTFPAFILLILLTAHCSTSQNSGQKNDTPRSYPAIHVYGNPACPHCHQFTNQLEQQKIPYKFYDITKNPEYKSKLWELIKKHHPGIASVGLPVVQVHENVMIRPGFDQFIKLL